MQGAHVSTKAVFIVQDYFDKMMLSKLGHTFDPYKLEQWEVESYRIIANTITEEENKQMNKPGKK